MRIVLIVGLGLLPAMAAAQGLGGVARSEAERREHKTLTGTQTQTQTYTNSDLRVEEELGADDSVAAGERAAESEPAAQPTSTTDRPDTTQVDLKRLREQLDRASARRKEREQKWRTRVAALRSKVTAARKEHDVACNPSSISLRGG